MIVKPECQLEGSRMYCRLHSENKTVWIKELIQIKLIDILVRKYWCMSCGSSKTRKWARCSIFPSSISGMCISWLSTIVRLLLFFFNGLDDMWVQWCFLCLIVLNSSSESRREHAQENFIFIMFYSILKPSQPSVPLVMDFQYLKPGKIHIWGAKLY
jgi:hypothetical protein